MKDIVTWCECGEDDCKLCNPNSCNCDDCECNK